MLVWGKVPSWELTYPHPKVCLKMIFFPKVGYVIVPWNITHRGKSWETNIPLISSCGMDWWLKCFLRVDVLLMDFDLTYFGTRQERKGDRIELFDGFVWLKFILICPWNFMDWLWSCCCSWISFSDIELLFKTRWQLKKAKKQIKNTTTSYYPQWTSMLMSM